MQKRGTLWMAALLALLLCMAACLPSALAEEFDGPSTDDGWMDEGYRWYLENGKYNNYNLPFKSEKSIYINVNTGLTAPSIDVTGDVETSGGGYIECAGLLQATDTVSVHGTITAGSLECSGITVISGTLTVKTSFELCGDKPVVTVNGTLILPPNTTQAEVKALKATGNGSIIVGTTTYSIDENGVTPVEGATIMLTDGCDVQDNGLNWNSGTCTLTLNDFRQGFTPDNTLDCGIAIQASEKDVTLVLKGTNKLTGLGDSCAGIMCAASTLTLKGSGSLDCLNSGGALIVANGTIAVADGCQLEGGELCNNSPGNSYIAVSSEDSTPATFFSLSMKNYSVTIQVEGEEGCGTATADLALAEPGETVTLTATPNPGYFFVRWEVISGDVTIENNTFAMPDSDVTIQAVFGKTSYAVTLHPNGGTIPEGSEITSYKYGEGATLPTDVTLDGYTFGGWYASADLTGDPVTEISATDMGDKAYWAKWTQDAPPYVPPTPVAPPEIDFTPGGDQPGGDEPGGDQPASVELEPGQSATLDLGMVDNYAAFAAAGVEIVATPVCDAGMTASAVVDQSGRILLNLYAIEPGEHQVSVTLSAAGCQPVTVAQITLTVPEAQPEDPEDPDAPDLPDIQPQEGTQAYTGVQGVTHLSLSQGTVVFTLPDLAGTEGVVWKSSKPKVVSIDPQTGEAQLKKSGTATLTATLPDGTTITQKVNVHKKDFAQPDTIRLQTKVDGKWTDVPEEGIVVVPKKSGQKSVPTRLVGDGGEIIIESIEADKALLTRSSGNPAPVKIKKRSLTDGQTTTLVIRANGQEFTLPITIDSTAKDLYPDPTTAEVQSILQQEEP